MTDAPTREQIIDVLESDACWQAHDEAPPDFLPDAAANAILAIFSDAEQEIAKLRAVVEAKDAALRKAKEWAAGYPLEGPRSERDHAAACNVYA